MKARPLVRYLPGSYVERFEEKRTGVTVTFRTATGVEELTSERLFVGAGVLPTTRLVLRSLGAVGQPVVLRDSQYYTFPLLRGRGSRVGVAGQGNTLAQAFVELDGPADPGRSSHVQVYGYNDLILREAGSALRLSPDLIERIGRSILSRLLFCQGYLHSDRSQPIQAELVGNEPESPLRLSPLGSPDAVRRDVSAAVRRLRDSAWELRAVPLMSLLRVWDPGRGAHVGGSFPMSGEPAGLQADVLGRPAGLQRVHLVDASVFPSVPPTTITFTVMANAQRIASEFESG